MSFVGTQTTAKKQFLKLNQVILKTNIAVQNGNNNIAIKIYYFE